MAQRCRVCDHESRDEIDRGLATNVSVRTLAERHKLSKDSIFRHRRAHLRPGLARAISGAHVQALLADIDLGIEVTRRLVQTNLAAGNDRLVLSAIREWRAQLDSRAKLLGLYPKQGDGKGETVDYAADLGRLVALISERVDPETRQLIAQELRALPSGDAA